MVLRVIFILIFSALLAGSWLALGKDYNQMDYLYIPLAIALVIVIFSNCLKLILNKFAKE